MAEPDPTPPASPQEAAFENLLVAALERLEAGGPSACEAFLAEHAEHAPQLRAHLEVLHQVGVVGDGGPPAPEHPERLGDFRIVAVLGGGGMGVVYRAIQESLGREVALKVVRPDQLLFPGTRERFRREIELVARMQHPGIVPIHSVGNDGGVPYFAMELVRGASLADVVERLADSEPSRLDGAAFDRAIAAHLGEPESAEPAALFAGTWLQAVLRIVREVAEALEHAHRRGVLHRDVKPSNVMLTRDGRVLLLDFGLAGVDGGERLTRTGSPLGSLAYMAPELLAGTPTARDARSDVYSLGVTCWELLALQLPYQSSDPVRLMALAGDARRPKLTTRNAAVGWDVETVVATAMDPDPGRRYPSASRLSRDVDNVLANRPIEARDPGAWLRLRRWTQRHPARAVAAVATFLLLCVAPTVFLWQQHAANTSLRRERDLAREAVEVLLTRVATEDLLHTPRMQGVRRDLLVSARSFYDRFLEDSSDDADLLADAAWAALQLATLDEELGRAEAALGSATKAVVLARELAASTGAPAVHLPDALLCLGRVQRALGESEPALANITEARDLLAAARAADADSIDVATDLLAAERVRAHVLGLLARRAEEAECYRRIAALWQEIDARTRGTAARAAALDHVLAAAANEAEIRLLGGQHDAARDALEHGMELVDELDRATAPAPSLIAAARLRLTTARLHVVGGDDAAAEPEFRAALAGVAAVLESNPDNANALRVEADAWNSLSVLMARAERRDEAFAALAASTERLRRLIAIDPRIVGNRANLAVNLGNLGAMLQAQGKLREALAMFDEARPHLDAALAAESDRSQWREHDFKLMWFRGQVTAALGMSADALAAARAMAAMQPDDARFQRIAAGLCATAAGTAPNIADLDARARETLRTDAETTGMALLRRAAEMGCTDLEWLRSSAEFAPLRGLDGYAAILATVEGNVARKAAAGLGDK